MSDLVKVNDFEFGGSRSGSGRWSSSDALSKGGLLETLSKGLSGNDRASGCSLSRGRGGFLSLVLSSSLDDEPGEVPQFFGEEGVTFFGVALSLDAARPVNGGQAAISTLGRGVLGHYKRSDKGL